MKNLRKCAMALLAAAGVAFGATGISACTTKSVANEVTGNVEITKTPAPADGSLPTAHTGSENLAYIAAVLDGQSSYHSYAYTVTNASIATQVTRTWKDYKDGVLITSDVTYSTMVKSGSQTCTVYGEEGAEVYFRESAVPESSTTNLTAVWDTNPPTYFTGKAFNTTYGLLQTELSSYIINEDSILESSEVTVNSDGTYTQSFVLDPSLSTYYYQFGMKTRGGLASYPEFESVTLSATFDASWRILSLTTRDISMVNKGVKVRSVSDTTTTFSYDEAEFDGEHFSFYDSYYRQFLGDDSLDVGGSLDEELVLDVTNVLSNGFSKILGGGDQFRLSADIGNNSYVGYIFAGLDLEDILGSLNVKVSLGKSYADQTLYVEYADGEASAYYGKNFALDINLAEVKLAVGQFEELLTKFGAAVSDIASASALSDEGGDVLSEFMNSLVLETTENSAVLVLKTDDLLGTGLGIDAVMNFGVSNNSITFRNVDINSLSLGGEQLNLSLSLKVSDDALISREDTAANADLADYLVDVHSLLSSDLVKLSFALDGNSPAVNVSGLKGLKIDLDAYCNIEGLAVSADLGISYNYKGTPVSALASVWYDYDPASGGYGTAILTLKELKGKPVDVMLICDIAEVAEGIGTLVTYSGGGFDLATDSLVSMINKAFSSDISSLIGELYADNASIKAGVNVDTLLNMLGVNAGVNFGSCTLVYEKGVNGANGGRLSAFLPAIGFSLTAEGADGQISRPDTKDALNVAYVIEDIEKFANAQLYKAEISFDGSQASGLGISELAGLKADLTAYLDANNVKLGANVVVSYTYNASTITLDLSAWYDNASGNIILKLNDLNGKQVDLSLYANTADLANSVGALIGAAGVSTDSLSLDLDAIIAGLLSADMNELLPNLAATSNGLNVSVNADKLVEILGANLGITLGNIDLAYSHAEIPVLTANAPALGLGIDIVPAEGEINIPDIKDALNVAYVIEDIEKFANAQLYKAEISFDGSQASGLGINELAGLKADLTAYLDANNVKLGANVVVSYTYKTNTIILDLSAWYEYDSQTIGNVTLKVNEINGRATDIAVGCNIAEISEAVEALLETVCQQNALPEISAGGEAADIISNLLAADFSKLICDLGGSSEGLSVTIDADYLLDALGAQTGLKFGKVSLVYTHGDIPAITAALPALGLAAGVTTAESGMEAAPAGVQNLADLVKLITSTVGKVNDIIDGQVLSFAIEEGQTFVTADGLTAEIFGEGEISWNKADTFVALDLSLRLTETTEDRTDLKFVYIANPADNQPVIRLIINEVGIDIYPEDVELVKTGFENIFSKISGLIDGGNASTAPLAETEQTTDSDRLMSIIFGLLASDGWVEKLGDLSLDFEENSVILSYLRENTLGLEVMADGSLAVDYSANFEGVSLGGRLRVDSGSSSLISAIDNDVKGGNYTISSSSEEGSAEFTRLAYDFLFNAIYSVSIDNILGSDTYTVSFVLNGDKSGIAELKDVNVSALLYMTGENGEDGKIAEADLSLNVQGVRIELNVVAERMGNQTYFYINLSQVLNFKLPDLKVMATQSSLYDTIKVLLTAVTDTDVAEVIGTLIPSASSVTLAADSQATVGSATISKIADVVETLLSFNFSQAFVATRVDDVTTATVDLDNIAKQLGLDCGALGSIQATINHKNHTIKTSALNTVLLPDGTSEEKTWLSLSSEKTARRDYSSLDRNEYINIEFLPDLLADLINFATDDNGEMYGSFTFNGSISADIVGIIKINIDITTLTVSFNEGQGFYFSLIGNLSGGIVTSGTIGITYQDNYLTLARDLAGSPEYKVMTFDYFIDHLFATDGSSTLNYLLGVGSGTWNLVVGLLGDLVEVNSGITTPEEIFLYNAVAVDADEEISLYDYIKALNVIIGGRQTANIGDASVIESKLGITDNYYGFSLNAGVLTDGVLTELIAAITRSDEQGINGIKAYGAIQSYVSFSLDLGYVEGLTPADSYELGTPLVAGKYAPSLFVSACDAAAAAGAVIDFDHYYNNVDGGYAETFGCFSTADMTNSYSHELYTHTLTIVKLDGTTEERTVRHGSRIYTYSNSSPVYAADGTRLLYSYTVGGDVADDCFTLNGDITLWEITRAAVRVYLVSGMTVNEIQSFVGDDVPRSVNGLSTIDGPYYSDGTLVKEGDKVGAGINELWLSGTFIESEIVVNYVKYTFDASTNSYVASGKAAGFNDKYSVKGETLVLESAVSGYPVTAIADYAFANTDGKPIKSVVVPASITKVGAAAFLDNYGMESAVFLADSVTFGGTVSDKTTPFYGCSLSDSSDKVDGVIQNETTLLKVYYNNIVSSENWKYFRGVKKVFTFNFYIGEDGGATYGAGSWDYVVYAADADVVTEVSVADLLKDRQSGIMNSVYSGKDELRSYIEAQLSQYKNAYGENKYVCEVIVGKDASGATLVTVSVSLNIPTTVTVYSTVALTYNGQSVEANTATKVTVVKSDDNINLFSPEAVGYTFLGWATKTDGGLEFVGKTTEYLGEEHTYYAVWGASKVGAEFTAEVNYGGTAISAPSGSAIDGKWYDAQWREVTSLGTDNTIVYTRSSFTVTYTVKGNLLSSMSDSYAGYNGSTMSHTASFSAMEGQNITSVRSSDKYSMIISVDGQTITTLTLNKTWFVRYTFIDAGQDYGALSGNLNLTFNY